ncbi:MAG: hypothetical protein IJK28_03370 [Clostridia bacterium]|nr:hypothetical protein [Clostridia bacterium]
MRRILTAAFALCLLLTVVHAGAEETEIATVDFAMGFFTGLSGDAVFALPGTASLVRDADSNYFTDSVQLMGYCAADGAEFQLHAGDISGMIEAIREPVMQQLPEATEDTVRLNALIEYIFFVPRQYGADITSAKPHGESDTDRLWVDITFTYPDTPGVSYYCKGLLSGTRATGLIIEGCDHAQAALDALRFPEEDELESLRAEMSKPFAADIGGLSVTFPRKPVTVARNGSQLTESFAADWTRQHVQYQPADMTVDAADEELADYLLPVAKKAIAAYKTDQINDPVASRPAPGAVQLDFTTIDGTHFGEMGPRILMRVIVAEYGVWFISTDDTETGRAFLDSVSLTGDGQGTPASTREAQAPAAAVEPAVTLPAFKANLETLNVSGPAIEWTRPTCTDGEWIAVGVPTEAAIGGVLVYLDCSTEEAAIREIRVVAYDALGTDGLRLAELAAQAYTGEAVTLEAPTADETSLTLGGATLTAQHIDVEGSSLVYDRVRIVPETVLPKLEEIRFPEDEDIVPLGTGITAAVFDERLARMQQDLFPYPVDYMATNEDGEGNKVRLYMAGNYSTALMVYLDGPDEETAAIDLVVAMDVAGDAPSTLGITMLAFAVVSDQSDLENLAMSYLLLESPMWDQLCDRWPLLARDGTCAHLDEREEGDGWMPMGFVAGRP